MAPRQTSSSNKKKSASTTRSATTRRARVSGRELTDDAEVSGDELESNSFSIPFNAPGPLLKHSHPDSAYWLPFDNDESRRVVVLFSEDGEINNLRPLDFQHLAGRGPYFPPTKGKGAPANRCNGPLFLLGSDYHIPAVQPPPKSAARSSAPTKRLAPVNDDSDVEMPAPSKKQRFQEVEVRVSPPPRPVPRPAARKTSPPEVPRPPPAPTQSVASSSKLPSTVPSTRKEVLAANPQKPVNIPTRGVRPLPALEVIPSHFVQDACTPALFSDASFACLSCINRAKSSSCDGRQFGTPCKTCKDNNTHCSYKADPERFIGLMEDLRPLFTLGTDALSSALLSVVRARQEADSAYRHLAYRLSVYDLALTDLIRVFSTQEDILRPISSTSISRTPRTASCSLNLRSAQSSCARTWSGPYQAAPHFDAVCSPDAPDSRPVFNKRYPPDLNPALPRRRHPRHREHLSSIFAGGAAFCPRERSYQTLLLGAVPCTDRLARGCARCHADFRCPRGVGFRWSFASPSAVVTGHAFASRSLIVRFFWSAANVTADPLEYGQFQSAPAAGVQPCSEQRDPFPGVATLAGLGPCLRLPSRPASSGASSLGFRQQRLHLPVVCLEEASAIPELAVIGGCVAQ
ncbi:hypothetical protein B0H12DRAFT_1268220 [Mycena haematopus]|nr:hypothetical protein B0H12DRAFT_1268220 [Mycena haematopus]